MVRFLTCALLWIPSAAYAQPGNAEAVEDLTILAVALDVSLQIWNDEASGIGLGNDQLSSFEMVRFSDNGVIKHDVFIGDGGELDLQILDINFQPLDPATPFLSPWSGVVNGEPVTGSLDIFSEIPPEVEDEFAMEPTLGTFTPQNMTMRWRWSTSDGPVTEVTLTTTLLNIEALMQHPSLPFAGGIPVDGIIGSLSAEEAYAVAGPSTSIGTYCGCNDLNTLCAKAADCTNSRACPTPPASPPGEVCRFVFRWFFGPPTIEQG